MHFEILLGGCCCCCFGLCQAVLTLFRALYFSSGVGKLFSVETVRDFTLVGAGPKHVVNGARLAMNRATRFSSSLPLFLPQEIRLRATGN